MAKFYPYNRLVLGLGVLVVLAALTGTMGVAIAPAANPELSDAQKHQQALAMYREYKKEFPQVRDIEADAAIGLLPDPEVVFVDVRKRREQAVSMIPGAIPHRTFKRQLKRYAGKRIILYCTISYRSGKFASNLSKKGLTVLNLKAGLLGWAHAGGPLADSTGLVNRMHVYGSKWDLAPAHIETEY